MHGSCRDPARIRIGAQLQQHRFASTISVDGHRPATLCATSVCSVSSVVNGFSVEATRDVAYRRKHANAGVAHPPPGIGEPPGMPGSVMARTFSTSSSSSVGSTCCSMASARTVVFRANASFASLAARS